MRCMMLRMMRSACSSERRRPETQNATSPGFTRSPSLSTCSNSISGSRRWNTTCAISMPAMIPSCLHSRRMRPCSSEGMHESDVWSPSPMSSLMQSSIRASTNGLYSAFISLRFSMQSYKRIVPLYTALWSSVSSPTGICALRQVKITSRTPLASLPVNIGIANPLPVCGS